MEVIIKPQSNSSYGINRLEPKTARAAIIQKIASDFNFGILSLGSIQSHEFLEE